MTKKGVCSSENISVRKDNETKKVNHTMNGKLPPSSKINSNWEMLLKSPEFASILEKIPDQKVIGIDLKTPNYSPSPLSSSDVISKPKIEKSCFSKFQRPYSPSQSRSSLTDHTINSKEFQPVPENSRRANETPNVSINFFHINIVSSNESQQTLENQQTGRVTPDNTMVKSALQFVSREKVPSNMTRSGVNVPNKNLRPKTSRNSKNLFLKKPVLNVNPKNINKIMNKKINAVIKKSQLKSPIINPTIKGKKNRFLKEEKSNLNSKLKKINEYKKNRVCPGKEYVIKPDSKRPKSKIPPKKIKDEKDKKSKSRSEDHKLRLSDRGLKKQNILGSFKSKMKGNGLPVFESKSKSPFLQKYREKKKKLKAKIRRTPKPVKSPKFNSIKMKNNPFSRKELKKTPIKESKTTLKKSKSTPKSASKKKSNSKSIISKR